MGQTGARCVSVLAPGGAPGVRGSARRARWQQTWPHSAPALHWGGQAEAGGGRGRAHNTEAVASLLGLRSSRHTRDIINKWISRLTSEEREMLRDYFSGADVPDEGDPFPELGRSVDQTGMVNMGLSKSRMDLQ